MNGGACVCASTWLIHGCGVDAEENDGEGGGGGSSAVEEEPFSEAAVPAVLVPVEPSQKASAAAAVT